ncbi:MULTISPECIES: polysaccharide deacetylase family protein [unclassified Treponema]|uniref:polysaccharide deacetylase family protein n=1 Tax=unclassified Treponema TaxID=2638727 RepID=UPI0020A56B08|nr:MULTISPECIES: polysaccharide deacetylase family protein [unclassified Treponema]UTC66130.1 polysaccharide deacetylase family protein [Treponema sp. OMZ 789]UTC68859.1 polysaccharide deacetylase family protein [Treponema sp. OMZ 790]UTC71587.1 polysaccharide deacetylase family protein [Treponema sp. OMZ 791]
MKKNLKFALPVCFIFFALLNLHSELYFESADINTEGDILFDIKADAYEGYSYKTLFKYSHENNKIEQLTFFPEKLQLLGNNKFLQVSNRFGIIRLDLNSGVFDSHSDFEPLSASNSSKIGALNNIKSSPDGRWLTLVEPVTLVHGRLVLTDTHTGRRYTLSEKNVRNDLPVSWSPDSKIILYEDAGMIYFARPEWFSAASFPDKNFRRLSKGKIKNLRWISSSEFIFLSGNAFYKVSSTELFTKAFYGPLFSVGKLAAKIPSDFSPAFDSIFIAPDGRTAIFVKGKRNVYYIKLDGDDYVNVYSSDSIPYLLLPGNTAEVSVHWKGRTPIVFAEGLADGTKILRAWQILPSSSSFEKIPIIEKSSFLAASPNFEVAAFKEEEGIVFYSTSQAGENGKNLWKKLTVFSDEKIVTAVWKNNFTVFLGGENYIYEYNLNDNPSGSSKKKISVSSMQDYSWSDSGKEILITSKIGSHDSGSFETLQYASNLKWSLSAKKIMQKKNSNLSDRIYIDSSSGYFANMIYIRRLKDFITRPLLEDGGFLRDMAQKKPSLESTNSSSVFSHGSRSGKKRIALVFDAMDDMDGIANILYTLKKNNIGATFFINGEAMRQNPNAVKEIVKSGHQCGSLFFTTWNLNDTGYRIDEGFIKQGLARNEDNFYSLTGSELSLIWHTPHYIASSLIIGAGKNAGYIFISPDVRLSDWISPDEKPAVPYLYKSSAELIEDIAETVQPGSIVPIRIGKTLSNRGDYLYYNLQLLIDVLTEMGYSITDVKTLMGS